jgi:hypothetical protein
MMQYNATDFLGSMFGREVAKQMARAKDIRPAAEFMLIASLVDMHGFAPDITVGELRAMANRRQQA